MPNVKDKYLKDLVRKSIINFVKENEDLSFIGSLNKLLISQNKYQQQSLWSKIGVAFQHLSSENKNKSQMFTQP